MIWTFACLRYPAKVLGLESDTWRGAPHTVIYDHHYFEARAARESVGSGIPGEFFTIFLFYDLIGNHIKTISIEFSY